jgi:hypothetical protein
MMPLPFGKRVSSMILLPHVEGTSFYRIRRAAGHRGDVLPIWEELIAHPFEPWTRDHLVLDTAMISLDDAAQRAETYIIERSLRVAR